MARNHLTPERLCCSKNVLSPKTPSARTGKSSWFWAPSAACAESESVLDQTVVFSTRRGSACSVWTNIWVSSPIRFRQSWLRRNHWKIQNFCNSNSEVHVGLQTVCTDTSPATNWLMVVVITLENQLENPDYSFWPVVLCEPTGYYLFVFLTLKDSDLLFCTKWKWPHY